VRYTGVQGANVVIAYTDALDSPTKRVSAELHSDLAVYCLSYHRHVII
jgi:hypothetical protein